MRPRTALGLRRASPGQPEGHPNPAGEKAGSGVAFWRMMALLFLVGLETDVRLIRRRKPLGIWIGLGGSLGALLVTGAAIRLGSRMLPGHVPTLFSSAGLLLCAAAAFSSSGR